MTQTPAQTRDLVINNRAERNGTEVHVSSIKVIAQHFTLTKLSIYMSNYECSHWLKIDVLLTYSQAIIRSNQ